MRRSIPCILFNSAVAGLTLCLAGCQCPALLPPAGPMDSQQARAVIHDPFPQNDIGPYEAASRPPGYQRPLPEAERNRIVADNMPWLGR